MLSGVIGWCIGGDVLVLSVYRVTIETEER